MKADPDVKMISAEAPILFAKGCDIFITELTMRAWIHAEENKRRTLQRSDIASALAKSDMFDFLIDIVPREEAASHAKRSGGQGGAGGSGASAAQASSGNQIIPPQNNVQQPPPPGHPQQASQQMGHADYSSLGSTQMAQEQEYRPQSGIYAPQVPPDPTNAYGHQPQQMFEGLYNYPLQQSVSQLLSRPISRNLLTSRKMYSVTQRGQDPSGGQNTGHQYQRHEGGEGDADAEGERDYEVG